LQKNPQVNLSQKITWGMDICSGMAHLIKEGLVHREYVVPPSH
jgi:hypothetical protein